MASNAEALAERLQELQDRAAEVDQQINELHEAEQAAIAALGAANADGRSLTKPRKALTGAREALEAAHAALPVLQQQIRETKRELDTARIVDAQQCLRELAGERGELNARLDGLLEELRPVVSRHVEVGAEMERLAGGINNIRPVAGNPSRFRSPLRLADWLVDALRAELPQLQCQQRLVGEEGPLAKRERRLVEEA